MWSNILDYGPLFLMLGCIIAFGLRLRGSLSGILGCLAFSLWFVDLLVLRILKDSYYPDSGYDALRTLFEWNIYTLPLAHLLLFAAILAMPSRKSGKINLD